MGEIKRNMAYTSRTASEIFETSVMKTDEVVLFVKAATEAGTDVETAFDDMHMIDSMMHMKEMHSIVHGSIKRTAAGHLRKGSLLYDALNDMLTARVALAKERAKQNE